LTGAAVARLKQPWIKRTIQIPAGNTLAVDSLADSDFSTLTYQLSIENATTNKIKSMSLLAKKSDSTISDQVYARSGDDVSIQVATEIISNIFNLKITNNEAETVAVTYLRFKL